MARYTTPELKQEVWCCC